MGRRDRPLCGRPPATQCMLPPLPPPGQSVLRPARAAAMRVAEPAQREDHKKLSKHAKKRAKDDRERQIRDAELRRLKVGSRERM